MNSPDNAAPQLALKTAYVSFIYSFAWDAARTSFASLSEELRPKGWHHEGMHQRYIEFNGGRHNFGAYHPTLLPGGQEFLYRTESMSDRLEIISPQSEQWWQHAQMDRTVLRTDASLKHYIRLLENGAGTCTLTVRLAGDAATFVNLHRVLHLGQNVSFGKDRDSRPMVFSWLRVKPGAKTSCWLSKLLRTKAPQSDTFGGCSPDSGRHIPELPKGVVTLHEVFNRLMFCNRKHMPSGWLASGRQKEKSMWLDWALLNWGTFTDGDAGVGWRWQNPYVFTICELSANDQRSATEVVKAHPSEIATILCKMNLDSPSIESDYRHINQDYIHRAFPANKDGTPLANLSHDDRLYFTFSRRGAVALTHEMTKVPSYFVLPSLVNLLEILRGRWHLGNVVDAVLDTIIEDLAYKDRSSTEMLDKVFRWRTLYSLFLRDPVPYLFDGGAITEVAELAETELWLAKLRHDVHRKFDMLDGLLKDVLERQRIAQLTRKWRT